MQKGVSNFVKIYKKRSNRKNIKISIKIEYDMQFCINQFEVFK